MNDPKRKAKKQSTAYSGICKALHIILQSRSLDDDDAVMQFVPTRCSPHISFALASPLQSTCSSTLDSNELPKAQIPTHLSNHPSSSSPSQSSNSIPLSSPTSSRFLSLTPPVQPLIQKISSKTEKEKITRQAN